MLLKRIWAFSPSARPAARPAATEMAGGLAYTLL